MQLKGTWGVFFSHLNFNKFLPCADWREEERRGWGGKEGLQSCAPFQPNEHFPSCSLLSSGHPVFTCWLCGCVLRLQTCVFASTHSSRGLSPPVSWLLLRVTDSIKRWHLCNKSARSFFFFFFFFLSLRGKSNSGGWGVQSLRCVHVKREESSSGVCYWVVFIKKLDQLIYSPLWWWWW